MSSHDRKQLHGTQLHIGTDMIHMIHMVHIGTDIDKAAPLRVSEMLSNKLNCFNECTPPNM